MKLMSLTLWLALKQRAIEWLGMEKRLATPDKWYYSILRVSSTHKTQLHIESKSNYRSKRG